MKGSEAVFGYEVTYSPMQGDEQPFTTNQIHRPVDGRFYSATVVRPVVYQATPGWKIDASDPYVPVVIGPTGQRVPLNKAIAQGAVVVEGKWERDQVDDLTAALGQAKTQGIAG